MYELDGLLFVHGRLIIPSTMRSYVLQLIHEGHLGMEKCKIMARRTISRVNQYGMLLLSL